MIQTRSMLYYAIILSFSMLFLSCQKDVQVPVDNGTIINNDELGITSVPSSLGSEYVKNFDRYTQVKTSNGKSIHIIAQSKITDEQIIRCRGILEHFLMDYPQSELGSNKEEIANKMADNGAKLLLLNGQDDGNNPVELDGQPLFQNEIQVEGHDWYIQQDYEHRDAAYEEILHLVHDYGIGVDGPNSNPGAAPEFQQLIRAAQINAQNNELWGIGVNDWINELSQENSLSQEYLASVIDSYYGLWGAFLENQTHGMWGIYIAKTREEIQNEDPMAYNLVNGQFFHPYITYNARIDSSFQGDFSLKFSAELTYTHHSRYLKDITLLGNHPNNVVVNELDNDITGNSAENTVIFSGVSSEYNIQNQEGKTIITDNQAERDGINTLSSIEFLQFSDKTINL